MIVECPKCHGDGELRAEGYSLSPSSGVLTPDPQAETFYRCDLCDGSGEVLRMDDGTVRREP